MKIKGLQQFRSRALRLSYGGLSAVGAFRLWSGQASLTQVAVITYHGIQPRGYARLDPVLDGNLLCPQRLRQHIKLLKKAYHIISPEQFLCSLEDRCKIPARAVLITCDDGHLNNLTDMLEILVEENTQAMFFVTSDPLDGETQFLWHEGLELVMTIAESPTPLVLPHLGRFEMPKHPGERRRSLRALVDRLSPMPSQMRWDVTYALARTTGRESWLRHLLEGSQPTERRFRPLNAKEVRVLVEAGMTIGSHTCSHPRLASICHEAAAREICESRAALTHALKREVWAIAYPFGDPNAVSSRDVELARRAGYRCGFLNYGGITHVGRVDKHALYRIHVGADVTPSTLDAMVSGWHDRIRALLSK